jgi:Protein of unknown function (DUF3431)
MNIEKHLVISSYNHDMGELTKLGIPFTIYDQSDDLEFTQRISREYETLQRSNCGHSLSNIFEYICTNYADLPELIIFVKANIVPRHCTKAYFQANIHNNFYTHLYHEELPRTISGSSDYLTPGYFLETNNSWYSATREHHLFCKFDDFYKFLFSTNREPEWLNFSPGACFIVEAERVRRYPKSFWQALNRISTYIYFPAEAYMVERLLPAIFQSSIPLQPWMHDSNQIDEKIDSLLETSIKHSCATNPFKKIFSKLLIRLK